MVMTMTDAERAALKAAMALHYLSFPCLKNKAPACPNGFKAAITPDAGLATLWARYPGPLVGVPTGAASGFDVLDVDPRNGGREWYENHRDRLPTTRMHRTRSRGLHVLFNHCAGLRNSSSKIAPGIDVRADGGYIIWWPAAALPVLEHPLTELPEWPLWLLPALMSTPKAPEPVYPKPTACSSDFNPKYVLAAVDRELEAVAGAPEGRRNETLHRAACKLGTLAAAGAIGAQSAETALLGAAAQNRVPTTEARKTIQSGLRFGLQHPRTAPAAGGRP
jgi:hypothetical protein